METVYHNSNVIIECQVMHRLICNSRKGEDEVCGGGKGRKIAGGGKGEGR